MTQNVKYTIRKKKELRSRKVSKSKEHTKSNQIQIFSNYNEWRKKIQKDIGKLNQKSATIIKDIETITLKFKVEKKEIMVQLKVLAG